MNSDKNDQATGLRQQVADLTKQLSDLAKIVKDQQTQIDQSKTRRMYQMDYTNQSVKNRHMGEPNSYVFSGLATNRPTSGVKLSTTGFGCSLYWAYDTHTLSIWDNNQWRTVTLA